MNSHALRSWTGRVRVENSNCDMFTLCSCKSSRTVEISWSPVQCSLPYFLCWFWLWLFLYLLSKWHLADFATEVVKSKQQNPGNQIGDSDPGWPRVGKKSHQTWRQEIWGILVWDFFVSRWQSNQAAHLLFGSQSRWTWGPIVSIRYDNSTSRKNLGDPGRSRFGPKANKTMTLLTLLQHCSLDSAD